MERIGGTCAASSPRFGPEAAARSARSSRAWPAAVGETIARNAWPARLGRDGTLHVNADSATWAFELGRMAATILEQLRTQLGDGPRRRSGSPPGRCPSPSEARSTDAATHGLQRRCRRPRPRRAELAAPIEDEELREAVARAAAASLARARSGRGF